MSSYTLGTTTTLGFDAAKAHVVAALAQEGFGVLAEIDIAGTLMRKLGGERAPYVVLGACNPLLASKALAAEPAIGALLPCNVVVRVDDAGATHVDIMDPVAVLALVDHPEVALLAADVHARMTRVLATLP